MIKFNDQGIAASTDYLASIAAEQIAAERKQREIAELIRLSEETDLTDEERAEYGTWSVDW